MPELEQQDTPRLKGPGKKQEQDEITTSGAKIPAVIGLWILSCAYCNFIGWVLSAIHQLNPAGYAVALAIGLVVLIVVWRKFSFQPPRAWHWRKECRRFRRLFPLAYLVVAGLAMLGGVLHAPNNYDALAYRTPRVLHWLAAGRWEWIHTEFHRVNTRTCGIEWVTAPLIIFTKTDRLIFLPNVVSFVLLPGRTYSLLTLLGVRRRVAWHWMWLFPTGYCFLLQAGSICNDLFGAVFAMAAIEFALRACRTHRSSEVYLSMLAAALMTAGKAFNILLLLPWTVAALPIARLFLARPLATSLVVLLATGASLAPTALLNQRYCSDWTGLRVEQAPLAEGAPVFHVAVNAVLLALHNFVPPVFPWSGAWERLVGVLLPSSLAARLDRYYEPAAARLKLGEMQMEEGAGLGFGLSVLLLVLICWRLRQKRTTSWRELSYAAENHSFWVMISGWAVLLVLMTRLGLSTPARYLAPSYVLLSAPILIWAGQGDYLKAAWWRLSAAGVFLLAGLLIVICPSRPLWPANAVLRWLGADQASHGLMQRAWRVYSVYGERADAFEPALKLLPAEANPLGLVTFDDPETSLWRPFGSRRILHILRTDTPEETRRRGIHWALVSGSVLDEHYRMSLEDWLTQHNAEIVRRLTLFLRAGKGPTDWYLVRLP
jgi:hypothetical protein